MKKIMAFVFTFILGISLFYGTVTYSSASLALKIWFENLVPSLFLGMVLIKMMDELGILSFLSKLLFPFSTYLFRITPNAFSLVFSNFFLGSPSGSLLIDEYVGKHKLSESNAKRLIYACTLSTPSFIVMTCGAIYLKSIPLGFALWVSQILSCLILLFFTRNEFIDIKELHLSTQTTFSATLKKAITSSGINLFYIGGYLLISIVLLNLFTMSIQTDAKYIIQAIGEFALGCQLVGNSAFTVSFKALLICMILGFSGFSVHLQIFSLISHIRLNYFTYLLYRIMQVIFSCVIFQVFLLLIR